MIQHTVAFTLVHAPETDEEREFLRTARETLTSIEGVQDFRISRQTSQKSTFAFQFSMVFADQATYDAYDGDPRHVQFVQTRWIPEVAEFEELDFVAYEAAD